VLWLPDRGVVCDVGEQLVARNDKTVMELTGEKGWVGDYWPKLEWLR
jgi:hypothetical protein